MASTMLYKRSVSDLKRPTVRKYINEKPETHVDLMYQISCRSYVGSVYRMRSLAVSGFSFMYFRTEGLFRSDTLRFLSMVLAMRLNV